MNTLRKPISCGTERQRRCYHLGRAIALAVLLWGVAAAPSQASSITFSFSPGDEVHDYVFASAPTATTPGHFSVFRLGFDQVLLPFSITMTDSYGVFGSDQMTIGTDVYDCVQMAYNTSLAPSCVRFTATGGVEGLPVFGTHYAGGAGSGAINVGIQYGLTGFPGDIDPVDLGETDNFSIFMVFARLDPKEYRLGHLPSGGGAFEDISSGHCGFGNIDLCAEDNDFQFAVPESASSGELLVSGLLVLMLAGFFTRRS